MKARWSSLSMRQSKQCRYYGCLCGDIIDGSRLLRGDGKGVKPLCPPSHDCARIMNSSEAWKSMPGIYELGH
jgi:hypothetical protein